MAPRAAGLLRIAQRRRLSGAQVFAPSACSHRFFSSYKGDRIRAQSTTSVQATGQSPSFAESLDHTAPGVAAQRAATRSNWEEWMVNLRGEDAWLAFERNSEWYTGKLPVPGICPGVSVDGGIRSLPMPNLNKVTREATQAYFDNSWTLMEVLFAGFKGEEPFYRPPVHGLRHPQIFYYGHTPCLYVNKLLVAGVLKEPVDPYLESIFEVGVDEMLWDDMHKNDMVWPTIKEVQEYRKKVYRVVSEVIATHPSLDDKDGTAPVTVKWGDPMWSLFMGFEHEAIHLETSSVLFRETQLNLMQVPKAWPKLHPSASRGNCSGKPLEGEAFPKNEMLPVAGCDVQLGKPRDFPSYGWDNEYGHRMVNVPDFLASKYMITNGEFWQFVADGGYRTERHWSENGWAWRKYRNMKWPFFWTPDGPQGSMLFRLRTVFEEISMQWDWPVDVNYHEAKAYCAWKSENDGIAGTPEAYRVITEAEHNLIRPVKARPQMMKHGEDDQALCRGGEELSAQSDGANLNLAYASQSPVNSFEPSPTGHHDSMGNAWEWTEDHFNPLDGFKVHPVYDDFSAPCFDGRHHMIMGGSFVSTGDNGASGFCRYHFRPHFLQHSGFRLVSSASPAPATLLQNEFESAVTEEEAETQSASAAGTGADLAGSAGYETRKMVDQYLGFHFPASQSSEAPAMISHSQAPGHALRFPQRVANLLIEATSAGSSNSKLRALDVGCAVGGTSFELAAGGFDEVVGLDFSAGFIEAAQRMQQGEDIRFKVPLEGELQATVSAQHEPNVDAAARGRTSFIVGDACRLTEADLGRFDGAVLANLLCRLPDPLACLDGLQAVIKPGGTVVIVTPFSWLEDFTPKSQWLGGYVDPSGVRVDSKEQLQLQMEKRGFTKLSEKQMPLLIREHRRKYQYVVSEATVWRQAA